ncbi:MAG: alpha-L-fucosidase [Candidatus Aminicenantes bacterium]|nr:alpha-L-fucosidase [Candidatus Aminicenantes bacterium]
MLTKKMIISLWMILVMGSLITAQDHESIYIPETDPAVILKIQEWQDLKFGLLMHWGPYSQWGIVESWSICSEDEPWCRRKTQDYIEYKKNYENLKSTFNPINFNPQKWAEAARDAGMKYVVLTTKHHDGFCMFDTQHTDYKITDPGCPFSSHSKADVTKEIFKSFREQGFWIGAYFSKPDWHSEYYWWPNFATPDRNVNYAIKEYPERWEKFVNFTHNQIIELMTNYGKIDILWLDGGWVRKMEREEILARLTDSEYKFIHYQSQDIRMEELVEKIRSKQPGLMVVDRAVPGKYQNYLTPENRVPEKMLSYPWETCMPMATSWSHVPDDIYKSPRQLIHLLIDIVAKGGNLLLNIGPDSKGDIDEAAYDRLKLIGGWMKINGEAIYATRPLYPYTAGKIRFTQKDPNIVYAFYLPEENEDNLPRKIFISDVFPKKGASVFLLGQKKSLVWEEAGNGMIIDISDLLIENPPCEYAWVIKIMDAIPETTSLRGERFYALPPSPSAWENYLRAKINFRKDANEENTIWLGRRAAYLSHYRESVRIYTQGLERFPKSYRLYRHRGHRFITLREFDRAAEDLIKASQFIGNLPLEIEPDGMTNKINLPLSNTQFNIYYHLGLSYYLKKDYENALGAFEKCLEFSKNDDLLVAASYWLYLTLRKIGDDEKSRTVLGRINPDMEMVENDAYLRLLLLYKGEVPATFLSSWREMDEINQATVGYGLGNWYFFMGDIVSAYDIFKKVIEGDNWGAFGYIAAEVELTRPKK